MPKIARALGTAGPIRARIVLAGLALPFILAACDSAAPELEAMPPAAATDIESAEAAYSASEDVPSEFEDATDSYGM